MASKGKSEAEVRKERLAAALRENLKRRKAQAREQARAKVRPGDTEKVERPPENGPKQAAKDRQ